MPSSLNIWLLRDCELLPLTDEVRQMRMGRLAQALLARGHHVTWWASTFDHFQKKKLFQQDQEVSLPSGLCLQLLEAGSYQRNFSLRRLIHHARLGKKFRRVAQITPRPDIIVAAFPTIELAYEGARLAAKNRIPFIVDVRDMWPDSFVDYFPGWCTPLIRLSARILQKKTVFCFQQAISLLAISKHVLAWALKKRKGVSSVAAQVFYLGAEAPHWPISSHLAEKIEQVKGRIVFSFIGSFGYAYDFDSVLEVVSLCANYFPQVVFFLAGGGEQWNAVAKRAKQFENISVLGWQNRTEATHLLAVSDVILIPCRFDAVPNKFCEALAWGRPVLVSGPKGAEMQEICEQSGVGLFFEVGDHKTLYQHIQTLMVNKNLREEMGKKAHRLYVDEFQADRVSEKYAQYIEEVATMKKECSV